MLRCRPTPGVLTCPVVVAQYIPECQSMSKALTEVARRHPFLRVGGTLTRTEAVSHTVVVPLFWIVPHV